MLIQVLTALLLASVEGAFIGYKAKPHQNLFCQPGVTVVLVKIIEQQNDVAYKVQLLDVFKQQSKKFKLAEVRYVKSECGVNRKLENDKVYVLSGVVTGKNCLLINKCDSLIVKEPNQKQMSHYQGGYDCSCQVKFCEQECEGDKDTCATTYFSSACYDRYSVCRRIGDNSCEFTDPEDAAEYDSHCDVRTALAAHFFIGK